MGSSEKIVDLLKAIGQEHVMADWPAEGDDEKKSELLAQVEKLDADYPGGLSAYVENAKMLLEQSKEGKNPFEGYTPAVPSGERLSVGTEAFTAAEEAGMAAIAGACFVIVAGGLGERLGYTGIKLELPSEMATERCFLGSYAMSILALQDRARTLSGDPGLELPLCIMTSGDTDEKTRALLDANANFGLTATQLYLIKQEKVPALTDSEARFATDGPYELQTKPHGHGDVHALLHSSGIADKWDSEGRKWVIFLQDTNGLVFRSIPAAVGVSANNNFAVNSLTVPRRPGEAVGGICRLNKADGGGLTLNVEYNQLDPLLQATTGAGDVPDESGFSPYPGNINVLVLGLPQYNEIPTNYQARVHFGWAR